MKITVVCENCGHILFQQKLIPSEVHKAEDVPHRIKTPVCSVCSKIKKGWVKK